MMVSPLQIILDTKLEVGNWPPRCRLPVVLAQRFHTNYPLAEGVEFREIDDPHCRKAEYVHADVGIANR